MKTVLSLILAAAAGFGVAYFLVGARRDSGPASPPMTGDAAGQGDKGLKFTPSNNRDLPPDVRVVTRTIYATGTNKLGAQEVLNLLLKLNPNAGEESRNRIFRQIIYHLQTL